MKTTFQLADLTLEIEAENMKDILRAKSRVDELRRDIALLCHIWECHDGNVQVTHRNVDDSFDYYDAVLTVHPYARISFGTHIKPQDERFPFFPGGPTRYYNPWAPREDDPAIDYDDLTQKMCAAVAHSKRDEWDCYRFAREWPNDRFKALAEGMKAAKQQRYENRRSAA